MSDQSLHTLESLWVNFVKHLVTAHNINPSAFEYNQCGCVTRFQDESMGLLNNKIREICEEVIGADEQVEGNDGFGHLVIMDSPFNVIRAQQRTHLDSLLNETKQ